MAEEPKMMDPDEAYRIMMQARPWKKTEVVPTLEAVGRVMVEAVSSSLDSPPFAKSAMDGYAVLSGDASEEFRILETVAAGDTPTEVVSTGTCSKIMTGAMIPEGADKVIRVEYTEERDGTMRVLKEEPYHNVIHRGENLKVGDKVLEPCVLKAQDIGVLASLGLDSIKVAHKPRVGIITTGSELCNPGETLKPGMIYNSNGYQLSAQAAAMDVSPKFYGTAVDKMENLESVISQALRECEVLLLSGGVSMGEFDLVPDSLRRCGVEIRFHRLAIKPGKPTLFGQAGAVDTKAASPQSSERGLREKVERFVFGMPGNPVSTFVIFEVFVKPFLYHMMGIEYEPSVVRGKLGKDLRRRDTERVEYIPVRLVDDEIHSIHYHGSSHLNALSRANALIRIERGVGSLDEGSWLDVRQI